MTGYPIPAISHKHVCLSGDLEGSPPPSRSHPSPFKVALPDDKVHIYFFFIAHCWSSPDLSFIRNLRHQFHSKLIPSFEAFPGLLITLPASLHCMVSWPWPGHLGHQGDSPTLAWILQQSAFAFLARVPCVGNDIHGVINWLEKRKLGKRSVCAR